MLFTAKVTVLSPANAADEANDAYGESRASEKFIHGVSPIKS
jgi:hypothetical protein